MKLFGRRTGRDESRPALSASVSRSGVPIMGEWPRSYEAQLRDAYAGNAVAQRAVKLVAEGVGEAVAAGGLAAATPVLRVLLGQILAGR